MIRVYFMWNVHRTNNLDRRQHLSLQKKKSLTIIVLFRVVELIASHNLSELLSSIVTICPPVS